ncbi:MAG: RluA family pseudouridine synthase [Gammaproteobacteria bacterium]|nr:RluA family pseudouridine synthase [Gammaproteobacteria bacterium]
MQNSLESATGVQNLTITAEHAGQRIDNFLLTYTQGIPKSHIYRIIRTGQVRVNGGRVKPTRKLVVDDTVRIPPLRQSVQAQVTVPDSLIDRLEAAIIHEDDALIVINKPAGVPVHAGTGLPFGVIEALRQSRAGTGMKPELAHRLDRGTSGVLVLGKSLGVGRALQDEFRSRSVGKHYEAVVVGHWPQATKRIDQPLSKQQGTDGERRVRIDSAGKEAVTLFGSSSYFAGPDVTSLQIEILTGRTHQIRVHTASAGHAIVGDSKYGGNDENRRLKRLGFDRLYLHCARLEMGGRYPLDIEAAVDVQWQQLLARD